MSLLLERLTSRKLGIAGIATALVYLDKIPAWAWVAVVVAYIVANVFENHKNGGQK